MARARPPRGGGPAGGVLSDDAFQPGRRYGCYRLLSVASYGSRLPDFARPRDTM
jgi:hypothetical protein